MGKPCQTVSEKRNQFSFPVLGDFDLLKLRSCPSVTGRLPSEELVASYTAYESPRSPLLHKSTAASKFAGRSLRPDVLNRSHALNETGASKGSFHPRKTLQALAKSQTRQAVNATLENDGRDAPIVASTLEKREEVSPVRMQPCPPSTSRSKDRHTGVAFRQRKFKGEYHGSTLSSEGNSTSKRGGCTEKRTNPETITVDNFIVDFSGTALRPLTDRDAEFEFEETQASEGDYKVKNNNQERSNVNISDCISEVRKGVTIPRTKRLTVRKQANSFVEIDCKMSRLSRPVCGVTEYCDLNKEKRTLIPSPLDEFARRQLGCNIKLCSENLELNESFAPKTCKDFDTTKEMMINNWLIDIPRVK